MARFTHNTFTNDRIQLDGHEFYSNHFRNCVLVYGGGPLQMSDNLLENVRWEFVDAAARTMALVASFYQQGGQSKQFVEMLLSTFGKPPVTPATAAQKTPPVSAP